MLRLPEALQSIITNISRLPGFGPKSAQRAVFALLKWPENETRKFGRDISNLRDVLGLCSRCGVISESAICPICADPERDHNILCLVSEWDSLLTLEQGNFYRGQYLVLGGLLAPLDNRPLETLELEVFYDRLRQGEITEVILALGATAEAEATADYLRLKLENMFPIIKISRLAQGIPLGAEIKYMDKETLRQSLVYRQTL